MTDNDSERPAAVRKPASLLLNFGATGWLQAVPAAIAVAGLTAIAISPAGDAWKILVTPALVLFTIIVYCQAKAPHRSGTLVLFPDGSARHTNGCGRSLQATLMENAWTGRWFCVMTLFEPESGRHYHCIVCAQGNMAGEYRRLLKFLHMRTSSLDNHKAPWS